MDQTIKALVIGRTDADVLSVGWRTDTANELRDTICI
jgi:hypothetical protein